MEGILYRWAVALQEYDFKIVYRKGTLNNNADALSRRRELTSVSTAITGTQTKVAMVEINSLSCYIYIMFITHRESKFMSWSCKVLVFSLAIHFNASVTFLLRVLEIL